MRAEVRIVIVAALVSVVAVSARAAGLEQPPQPYKPDFEIPKPAGSGRSGQQAATPASPSYVIGPRDSIRITVFDEAELSGTYQVDSDGMLMFPLIQRIQAGGLTLREFQDRLTAQLSKDYIKNPQVRVEVDTYKSQSVFVLGEVRAPGKVVMTGTMTLLEALAQAGSPTTTASSEITITHPKKGHSNGAAGDADGDKTIVSMADPVAANAFVLHDGDIVTVPKAQTFYISGNVRNPGSYVLQTGETLEQALAVAGGMTERGTPRSCCLRRPRGRPVRSR